MRKKRLWFRVLCAIICFGSGAVIAEWQNYKDAVRAGVVAETGATVRDKRCLTYKGILQVETQRPQRKLKD